MELTNKELMQQIHNLRICLRIMNQDIDKIKEEVKELRLTSEQKEKNSD